MVGKNNGGKTTVLEAVHMLVSNGAPRAVVASLERRGESHVDDSYPDFGPRAFLDTSHLFTGHRFVQGQGLRVHSQSGGPSLDVAIEPDSPDQGALFDEDPYSDMTYRIRVTASDGPPTDIPVTAAGLLDVRLLRRIEGAAFGRHAPPVRFLTADIQRVVELEIEAR